MVKTEESTKPTTTQQKTSEPASPAKKNNTTKIVLIIVGVIGGLTIIGSILFFVFIGSIFKEAAKNIDTDGKSGTVTVKSSNGQATTSVGSGAKIPDGFPSDVPIYEPSTVTYALKTDGKNYSVTAKTKDSPTEVMSYYDSKLAAAGWKLDYESSHSTGASKNFKKDNRSLVVSSSIQEYSRSDEKTVINLTINQDNEYTR